ncbi:hypothetical protein GGP65_003136 [Salinibacter ruber]|uniref:Uncharacterized protein n=1 Tax=Salinibacter ruber TaxID=146919 RepID=A0AAW5PCM4_9BACT|nr:hypothetical protein [Salinibacter ruber]MCS3665493.1 hypothetical protein [Salinibacter ruber]MCS4159546.1 hypothetical protein [Salinibacter ruber]MCS4223712.1 hypothetical protein [Salinibacter ruber]
MLEDFKSGDSMSGDLAFEDSTLEGSMSGREDAWMGRCLEEQPGAGGILLGSTSGAATGSVVNRNAPAIDTQP